MHVRQHLELHKNPSQVDHPLPSISTEDQGIISRQKDVQLELLPTPTLGPKSRNKTSLSCLVHKIREGFHANHEKVGG